MIIDYRCSFRNPSPLSKSAKAYILVHNNYALHLFQCSGAKKIIKGNEQAFNFDLHFKSCHSKHTVQNITQNFKMFSNCVIRVISFLLLERKKAGHLLSKGSILTNMTSYYTQLHSRTIVHVLKQNSIHIIQVILT